LNDKGNKLLITAIKLLAQAYEVPGQHCGEKTNPPSPFEVRSSCE